VVAAPQRVQYRRCQIGQDLSAARFVLNAKSILHPAGVDDFFTSSAGWGIWINAYVNRRIERMFNLLDGRNDLEFI